MQAPDLSGRIVSDPFGLPFVDETIEGVTVRAEAIRCDPEKFSSSKTGSHCRISGGLTPLSEGDSSISDLLTRAAAGLHLAQMIGGNQIARVLF